MHDKLFIHEYFIDVPMVDSDGCHYRKLSGRATFSRTVTNFLEMDHQEIIRMLESEELFSIPKGYQRISTKWTRELYENTVTYEVIDKETVHAA